MEMSKADGDIEPIEKEMIRRVFDFSETTAREVMVPLIDVSCLERGATCGEAVALASKSAHKRIPVFRKRVDQIVGVLDTLELLGMGPEEPIEPFVRTIDYVPGSRGLQELLVDLRAVGQQVAVVVDEFGGAEGIVSIEDILEEVVEEMQDEYDVDEPSADWIRQVGESDYVVNARIDLDMLQEELGLELPEGNYTTLAGFLLEKTRDVPHGGEVIDYQKVSFTVQRVTPRAILEVRVRWKNA